MSQSSRRLRKRNYPVGVMLATSYEFVREYLNRFEHEEVVPRSNVTFRHGKPLAAYLYLPRRPSDVSVRTEKHANGIIVDYAADGRPIGIEITSPGRASLEVINQIVSSVDEPAQPRDLAPLGAVA